jgi:calcium-independent phospholipase A2
MSWLDALGAATATFRNILGEASNPNKVLDVKSEQYSNRHIHCREEALVLYGSPNQGKYEIVLHRPCDETLHHAFRLVRVAVKYCNMYFIIFVLLCVTKE